MDTTGSALAGSIVRTALPEEGAPEWTATADANGRFRIVLDNEDVERLLKNRRHRELTFRVYDATAGVFLGSQNAYVSTTTLRGSESVTLSVDPTYGTRKFAVSGVVCHADGTPVAEAGVVLYRQDFRFETSLEDARTDQDGRFLIRYAVTVGSSDRADFAVRVGRPARLLLLLERMIRLGPTREAVQPIH